MISQPVEVILLRQLATYLAVPVWVMGADGDLLFYNEAAEPLIGRAFEDQRGSISADELAELFATTSEDGEPIPSEELPIVVALKQRLAGMRVCPGSPPRKNPSRWSARMGKLLGYAEGAAQTLRSSATFCTLTCVMAEAG